MKSVSQCLIAIACVLSFAGFAAAEPPGIAPRPPLGVPVPQHPPGVEVPPHQPPGMPVRPNISDLDKQTYDALNVEANAAPTPFPMVEWIKYAGRLTCSKVINTQTNETNYSCSLAEL
jgi:hypothetical protein